LKSGPLRPQLEQETNRIRTSALAGASLTISASARLTDGRCGPGTADLPSLYHVQHLPPVMRVNHGRRLRSPAISFAPALSRTWSFESRAESWP
jgi:hypothetical protein